LLRMFVEINFKREKPLRGDEDTSTAVVADDEVAAVAEIFVGVAFAGDMGEAMAGVPFGFELSPASTTLFTGLLFIGSSFLRCSIFTRSMYRSLSKSTYISMKIIILGCLNQ